MRKVSAEVRKMAGLLVRAGAPGTAADPPAWAEALRRCCEALCQCLAPLVGREGFEALLKRSFAMARAEHAWLEPLEVDSDSVTLQFEVFARAADGAEAEAACTAIIASFLSLLTALIGTELTRQLVSGEWPDVPLRDLDFGKQEGDG